MALLGSGCVVAGAAAAGLWWEAGQAEASLGGPLAEREEVAEIQRQANTLQGASLGAAVVSAGLGIGAAWSLRW